MTKIKTEIKKVRQTLNLTQKDLAELINISRDSIANYETGRVIPSADIYLKIKNLIITQQ